MLFGRSVTKVCLDDLHDFYIFYVFYAFYDFYVFYELPNSLINYLLATEYWLLASSIADCRFGNGISEV